MKKWKPNDKILADFNTSVYRQMAFPLDKRITKSYITYSK